MNSLAPLPVTIIAGDAVENNTPNTSAVVGNTSDDENSSCTSIAGDTITDSEAATDESENEVVARRERRLRPLNQCFQSFDLPAKQISGVRIRDICGVFYANWGFVRASGDAQERGQLMRRQFRKEPAQILIVTDATEEVARFLLDSRSGGDRTEYAVVRGNEPAALLIASRSSTCTGLRSLRYDVHHDHEYFHRERRKMAKSRMLACTVDFRFPIPHIGTIVNVLGVQGHHRTMKMEWPTVFNEFWDRCAAYIRAYNVHFMAGEFSMALTQVVTQLRSRGIQCDCCAWHPWRHAAKEMHGQALGFDSCGIFYISGGRDIAVQVQLDWGIDRILELTAVAEDMSQSDLDVYDGPNTPGQHWACYRSIQCREADHEKDLNQMLLGLLQPSFTEEQLQNIPRMPITNACPYLRIKQKAMSSNVITQRNGALAPGAQVPLCAYTTISGMESQRRRRQRAAKKGGKGFHKGKGKGDKGKGKGKGDAEKGWKGRVGKSAVAAPDAGKGRQTFGDQVGTWY